MADTALWLLPPCQFFSTRGEDHLAKGNITSLGKAGAAMFGAKAKTTTSGFHLYLWRWSTLTSIFFHMAGSNNWILDFWDMRFFAKDHLHMNIQYLDVSLQLVRPWECQKLNPSRYVSTGQEMLSPFSPHRMPEVSEYPSFPKSTACIKAGRFHRKSCHDRHGKMWHEVFSRPWCALASCQWGKRMEDMMDVALCLKQTSWNIFIENHNFDDELRMFNVFHPDDPIAFLACNLYLLCGL